MALVIEALFSMGLLIAVIWAVSLWRSASRDRAAAADALEKAEREAAMEAAVAAPGKRLHCMNCDHQFIGPMPEDGCPNCHLSTLVVPSNGEVPGIRNVNSLKME